MEEDPRKVNKQKLSDERRLEAIKQRERERVKRQKLIAESLRNADASLRQNKKIIFHSDDEEGTEAEKPGKASENFKSKTVLFEESSESENEEYRFEIRPQFEGERGKQLFEMSSQFTDERFRLDERFKESDEESSRSSGNEKPVRDEKNEEDSIPTEKEKNIEILESVLGFQIPRRPPPNAEKKRKEFIRFDPEGEDVSKYIRKHDTENSGSQKTKSKKRKVEKVPSAPEPVVSSERFYEVTESLKDVLNDPGPNEKFSFAQRFSFSGAAKDSHDSFIQSSDKISKKRPDIIDPKASTSKNTENGDIFGQSLNNGIDQSKFAVKSTVRNRATFFLGHDDPRLKDGVEFFRRSLPMEKVKEQWHITRDIVLDMFKKNRRAALKAPKRKSRTAQNGQHLGKRRFIKR